MAYELIFKYYEKSGSCEYDKSKELTFKKTVGDLENEMPLERLASAIFSQMARRDVLVFDVEIYEFTKKKLSFKETKNGIVIKNKKFNLGLDNIVVSDEPEIPKIENTSCVQKNDVQVISQQAPIRNIVPVQQPPSNNGSMIGNRKPFKKVVFSPSDLKYLNGKPWRFTPNKEYDVYRERMSKTGVGMTYLMIDDRNREFEVEDEFFISTTSNLIGDDEPQFRNNQDKLNWQGASNTDVPKLR